MLMLEILGRGQAWEREDGNPYAGNKKGKGSEGKGRMGTFKKETGR